MAQVAFIAAAAFTAIGQLQASRAQARALQGEAALRDKEAREAEQRGLKRIQALRREALRTRGAREAAFGASGVTLRGSPEDVLVDAAMEEEIAVQNVKFETGARAGSARTEGRIRRAEAKGVRRAGMFRAVGTVLGGAAQSRREGSVT